jgi:hypothetical protein
MGYLARLAPEDEVLVILVRVSFKFWLLIELLEKYFWESSLGFFWSLKLSLFREKRFYIGMQALALNLGFLLSSGGDPCFFVNS